MASKTNELPVEPMREVNFKPSCYNHFIEAEDGYILAYNAFSNSLENKKNGG